MVTLTGHKSYSVSQSFVALLFIATALYMAVPPLHARTWTDRYGNSVEAKFVRFHQNMAILNRSGKIISVPFADLSEEDQEYVQQQLGSSGARIWTDNRGRKLQADFVRFENGQVYVRKDRETFPIPFVELCPGDQDFLTDKLTDEGQEHLLPQIEQNSRTWTNSAGDTVAAALDTVSGSRVVLVRYGVRTPVQFDSLSTTDQQYVRDEMIARGEEHRLPGYKPPPKTIVASSPPRPSPPAPTYSPTPTYSSTPATSTEAVRQRMEDRARQATQATTSRPSYPQYETRTVKICTTCMKKLPESATSCSNCEARWKAVNERPQMPQRNAGNSYQRGRITGTIATYGGVIAFAGLFIGLIIRQLMS